jgi:hypothetical protein
MKIRIKNTGQVMSLDEFKLLHSAITFETFIPESTLNELGADMVFEGPEASGGTVYQYSQYDGIEQKDGKWYTKYILGPVFTNVLMNNGTTITGATLEAGWKKIKDDERAALVRDQRNVKLSETDWTQLDDSSDVNKAEWLTYRQALRDVTSQTGFPWNITWPVAPE